MSSPRARANDRIVVASNVRLVARASAERAATTSMFARALLLAWLACALAIAREFAVASTSLTDASASATCAACALIVRDARRLASDPFSRSEVRARRRDARRDDLSRVLDR